MYNYELYTFDRKSFIKHYEVKDGVIEIEFGDGTIEREPFSIEREEQLLAIEKAQVQSAKTGPFVRRGIFLLLLDVGILSFLARMATSIIIQESVGYIMHFSLITTRFWFLLADLTFQEPGTVHKAFKIAKDLKKNKLFLEIEEKVNQYGKRDDSKVDNVDNLLHGLNSSVRELGSKDDGGYQLNINQVDQLTLKELKQLRKNISNIEQPDKEPPKVHQKRR